MNDLIQARPLLQEELKRLIAEENVIDSELSQYFSMIAGAKSKQLKSNLSFESLDIASSVQKLEKVGPTFEAMQQDSKKMAAQVEDCRALSERLSSMVRRLDTMQIRAQQTLACTEDIMNLKDCKTKILIAIEERNLAAAVSYLRQVHEIDIIAAKSSDDYEIIKEKEEIIKKMVQEEFSNAIESSNIKSVMSLCPLLQTLGLESIARDTFLDFVEKTVFIAISADASSVEGSTDPATAYAKSLSSVFNSAYIIIQQYLPMVIQGMENSLGDVHFIRRLHKRCEQEAGMVLKRYMKFRRIREVMGAIKASTSSNASTGSTTTSSSGGKLLATPAEMHTIMDELALMIQYCCKYAKYIKHICKGAEMKQRGNQRQGTTATSMSPKVNEPNTNIATSTDVVVVFAGATEFDKMIEELLNKYYMEGEQWLMRLGVQQALSASIIPGGGVVASEIINNDNIHLDECFFLLQKCGLRAIATNNIHAACAVLHLIADLISSDLLNQANYMLNITITQLTIIMNDHMNQFKRSMMNNDDVDNTINDSTSSVSAGFKNALSLASTLTSSSSNNSNNTITGSDIKLEEEGGFSLTGNPNSKLNDPWGVANSIETFNILELCVRYTERLNRDITNAAMNVFASSDEEDNHNNTTTSSTTRNTTTTTPKSTGGGSGGASALDKVRLCRDDFEAAKISFSNALRQGAEKIVSSEKGLMKDIFTTTIGRQAPMGGIRFDESDQQFDQQPSLSLLPRILCLPIETLINISTYNLSERNKDMIVGMLADTCCERLEHFITQTTFRFAGALKMEEIVRTLSSLFSRYSSIPIRGRFSRLREIMLILTSDTASTASSSVISENFTQLNSNEVEAFLILRLDILNTASSK